MIEIKERDQTEILKDMETFYPLVTAKTALAAYLIIQKFHANLPKPFDQQVIDQWKAMIDQGASDTMASELSKIPFRTNKVGSEGDKDNYFGQAATSVKGIHGLDGFPEVWGVSDVVEGTTLAAHNKPGASSVLAVTEKYGLLPTPNNVHYLLKLIAPPQAQGIVSLNQPHENNLANLIDKLGIKPYELTQVTMDPGKPGREINQSFVDAAKKVGVRLELINVGDFMPGVRAALDPNRFRLDPVILAGRGGFEEGIMAGVAARALGGFMEAKVFNESLRASCISNEDPEVMRNNHILSLDQLVPSSPMRALLSASFITDDNKWFHQPGVRYINERYIVNTLVITHQGLNCKKTQIS